MQSLSKVPLISNPALSKKLLTNLCLEVGWNPGTFTGVVPSIKVPEDYDKVLRDHGYVFCRPGPSYTKGGLVLLVEHGTLLRVVSYGSTEVRLHRDIPYIHRIHNADGSITVTVDCSCKRLLVMLSDAHSDRGEPTFTDVEPCHEGSRFTLHCLLETTDLNLPVPEWVGDLQRASKTLSSLTLPHRGSELLVSTEVGSKIASELSAAQHLVIHESDGGYRVPIGTQGPAVSASLRIAYAGGYQAEIKIINPHSYMGNKQ